MAINNLSCFSILCFCYLIFVFVAFMTSIILLPLSKTYKVSNLNNIIPVNYVTTGKFLTISSGILYYPICYANVISPNTTCGVVLMKKFFDLNELNKYADSQCYTNRAFVGCYDSSSRECYICDFNKLEETTKKHFIFLYVGLTFFFLGLVSYCFVIAASIKLNDERKFKGKTQNTDSIKYLNIQSNTPHNIQDIETQNQDL